jgi:hypothetical protein
MNDWIEIVFIKNGNEGTGDFLLGHGVLLRCKNANIPRKGVNHAKVEAAKY